MTPDSQPPLPRRPDDPENLERLRKEARGRLDKEERPPAPVYGGAPIVTRRWTLRGLVLLVLGALAAIAAWFWFGVRPPATVYGGPPLPVPPEPSKKSDSPPPDVPQRPPAPIYGGAPL